MQSQHEPLARFKIVLKTTSQQEEVIWQHKAEWRELVSQAILEKVVRPNPKFDGLISVHLEEPKRGSIEVLLLVIGVIGLLAQYHDIVESIQLIGDQIGSVTGNTTIGMLQRRMPRGTATGNIQVSVTNTTTTSVTNVNYFTVPQESGIERSSGREAPAGQRNSNAGEIMLALAVAFIIGLGVRGLIDSNSVGSKITQVLQPVKNYDFESTPPDSFRPIGNPNNSYLMDEPGFNGGKSLHLNLLLAPFVNGTGHGGFGYDFSVPVEAKAISAHIFLPESSENPAQPIYAGLLAYYTDNRQAESPPTQLRQGYWTPLFWGAVGDSGGKSSISKVELWIMRPNAAYNGPVYVDDLVIYDLVPEMRVTPTPTRVK